MKREKIDDFVSTKVVHELIENNLDLLDFLRSRRDILVSRNSLDALTVILRERDKLINLLTDKVLHLNDEDHDEEVLIPKKANSTNKRKERIGIQTSITESDRAQSATDYIPTKWKTVRFINFDTGKVVKEFHFVEGNPEMENVVEYWRKVVKGGNPEKMIKFFHADDDDELM